MRAPLLLENAVQHYAWGSRSVIPELLGIENRAGRPFAELWIGAHPRAPSRAQVGETKVALDALIAAAPEEILGRQVVDAFGAELPFLFKVLAAEAPLSLQCHPDAAQAQAGFSREEQAGIARDANQRNYRDARAKPELVVALGPFVALKGFRAPAAIDALLGRAAPRALAAERHLLAEHGLARFFEALLTLPEERRRAALEEAATTLCAGPPESRWVETLMRRYPGEIAALAPLFLNLCELRAGQALYLRARELHSYLSGTALEIMANSDNVLRGGLTEKHVDVAELLRVLDFTPGSAEPIEAGAPEQQLVFYPANAPAFRLGRAQLEVNAPLARPAHRAVEIALCLEGELELCAPDGSVHLARGRAALVPAAAGAYQIEGRGTVYIATVGVTDARRAG
jgi:mannose-6-phosphate isomerase